MSSPCPIRRKLEPGRLSPKRLPDVPPNVPHLSTPNAILHARGHFPGRSETRAETLQANERPRTQGKIGTRSPALSSDPLTQGRSEHRRHRQSAQSPYAQSEKHYGRRENGEVGVISHALANGPRESAFPMREHDREWCAHRETQELHPAQRVRERVVHERVGAGRKRRGAPATHVRHALPNSRLVTSVSRIWTRSPRHG